jgi:hypothetical protein
MPLTAIHAGESLGRQFQNPPEETKPWCYWYWYKSDITRDGITKDLEAMKKAGIRLAMIGNIDYGGHPPGPVKMFTPEWKAATKHAMAEGARLGVDIYMFNSPGWSQSGGPWIKPEQSMRRVIWNEIPAQGGPFSGKVRNAPQDIAVLAVPRKKSVSVPGVIPSGQKDAVSFAKSSWIWHPAEDGAVSAPAGTMCSSRSSTWAMSPSSNKTAPCWSKTSSTARPGKSASPASAKNSPRVRS